MKKYMSFIAASLMSSALLTGCGGNSDNTPTIVKYNGIFVDAVVSGVSWTCGVSSGVTGATGAFGPCAVGTSVSFSLGTLDLGTITDTSKFGDAKNTIITPSTLATATGDAKAASKISIALQSFDSDGDPSNGITINSDTVKAISKKYPTTQKLTDSTVTVSYIENLATQVVAQVISDTGTTTMQVVDKAAADIHLESSLSDIKSGKIKPIGQPVTTGSTGAN